VTIYKCHEIPTDSQKLVNPTDSTSTDCVLGYSTMLFQLPKLYNLNVECIGIWKERVPSWNAVEETKENEQITSDITINDLQVSESDNFMSLSPNGVTSYALSYRKCFQGIIRKEILCNRNVQIPTVLFCLFYFISYFIYT
jgi:hypothetical protein